MANKKTVEINAKLSEPATCTECNGAALINNGNDYCPRCKGTATEPVDEPANG